MTLSAIYLAYWETKQSKTKKIGGNNQFTLKKRRGLPTERKKPEKYQNISDFVSFVIDCF